MKKFFVYLVNNGNVFCGVLNYLPLLLSLGIIVGYGSHMTLFGALIASIIALFTGAAGFYSITIITAIFLGAANALLGGGIGTLFGILFLSGIILTIFSIFLYFKNKKNELEKSNLQKCIYGCKNIFSGFVSACAMSALLLSLPLIFAKKTYCALFLLFNSHPDLFLDVNENSIIIFIVTCVIYYYLRKIQNFPAAFFALLSGVLINYVYSMNLPSILAGFNNYKPLVSADFANFPMLLFFAIMFSGIIIVQTMLLFNFKNARKSILALGISNSLAAIAGSIAGSIAGLKNIHRSKNTVFIEVFVLALFTVFYSKIAEFIPISSIASILIIKCFEILFKNASLFKIKSLKYKILFVAAFLITLYNIVLGVLFILSFIIFNAILRK